jgi:Ca2+-binding EF-hand superfamily protein
MGASFNRLVSKGAIGGFTKPLVRPELVKLLKWSREDLCAAFERFSIQPSLSVRVDLFADALRLDSRSDEEVAFGILKTNRDKVDMLSVFAAMVFASDQSAISRISLLFSIFDLDSSGSVNGAEFFIGVRAVFHGLSLFFESISMLSKRDLEDISSDIFNRIDADKSGFITMGELVNYSYRSGDFNFILEPFPSKDQRIFEDLEEFPRESADAAVEKVNKLESALGLSPNGSSDHGAGKRRKGAGEHSGKIQQRAAKPPKEFSKAHTWFVYKVFVHLAGGGLEKVIRIEDLKRMIGDGDFISKIHTKVLSRVNQEFGSAVVQDLNKLVMHIEVFFHERHAVQKLDQLRQGSITLRAFFCVILSSLSEAEIESCLAWCQKFRAQDVLKEVMGNGQTQSLPTDDLRAIFKAMDTDGNGMLAADELVTAGGLDIADAENLLRRLDQDQDGQISDTEIKGILRSIDASLRLDFKNSFKGLSGSIG